MPITKTDPTGPIKVANKSAFPTAKDVNEFHTNDDTDRDLKGHHHTIGIGRNQATSGTHTHRGVDSRKIGDNTLMILTGELVWEDIADAQTAFNNLVTMLKQVINFTDNRSG